LNGSSLNSKRNRHAIRTKGLREEIIEKLKFFCEKVYLPIAKLGVALSKIINISERIAPIESFSHMTLSPHVARQHNIKKQQCDQFSPHIMLF